MKQHEIIMNQLKKQPFKGNTLAFNVFEERTNTYLDELTFYLAYFNFIPNFISQKGINCEKANEWFLLKYKNEIKDFYFDKVSRNPGDEPTFDDLFYVMYDDLVVNFDTQNSVVRFLFRQTDIDKIEEVRTGILELKEIEKSEPKIYLLIKGFHGIDIKAFKITKPKLNLDDNYNDDFKQIHQTIHNRLSTENDKGIVLLHGKPGTGKTSYIRYLISSVQKNIIFLPPSMAHSITQLDLMAVLINNPNSIFVIEDAENIVIDRESVGISPVSAMLNISDGLLSDCLNIQIICSFNTDLSKVDNALLRKGRLIARYEFKELAVEKANALSQKLRFNTIYNSPVPLSAIYNQNEPEMQKPLEKKLIGFKSVNSN
jgi:hypothetical protein